MKVLSINFGHDAAFAYFVGGKLVAFEELERTTRNKHHSGISAYLIDVFLYRSGITFNEIDVVAVCSTQGWKMQHCDAIKITMGQILQPDKPTWSELGSWPATEFHSGRDSTEYHDAFARNNGLFCETPSVFRDHFDWPYLDGPLIDLKDLAKLLLETQSIRQPQYRERLKSLATPLNFFLRDSQKPGFYVEHHACHAYYAHFYSGSEKSIICTHDGGAPLYPFNSGGVYLSDPSIGVIPLVSHNLGLGIVYDQVSSAVGLEDAPGKLMGLASYASPSPAIYDLVGMALEAFSTRNWNKIKELTGEIMSISQRDMAVRQSSVGHLNINLPNWQTAIQAASNTQLLVESIFTTLIGRIATEITQHSPDFNTIDLTGGFTFNCPSNHMLQQRFPRLKINPLPGAGDTGLPIGAATLIYHLFDMVVQRNVHSEGLDAAFPPTNILPNLELPSGLLRRVSLNGESLPEFIARSIIEGKVLCLHRGRSEVGPRALGHRSIIAHAISGGIRDRVNTSKGRELWRPLAPICREEDFHEYFEGDPKLAKYMLFTFRVLGQDLPAITHVDGTARVQCITDADDWLYPALKIIKEQQQHPVIINTSFNCAGEPLVETIEQATNSFLEMGFDYLVTEKDVFCSASDPLL